MSQTERQKDKETDRRTDDMRWQDRAFRDIAGISVGGHRSSARETRIEEPKAPREVEHFYIKKCFEFWCILGSN